MELEVSKISKRQKRWEEQRQWCQATKITLQQNFDKTPPIPGNSLDFRRRDPDTETFICRRINIFVDDRGCWRDQVEEGGVIIDNGYVFGDLLLVAPLRLKVKDEGDLDKVQFS